MSCNQLILELIGSQPIMPKNLPRDCCLACAHFGPSFDSNLSTMYVCCEPLSIILKLRDCCQMILVIYPSTTRPTTSHKIGSNFQHYSLHKSGNYVHLLLQLIKTITHNSRNIISNIKLCFYNCQLNIAWNRILMLGMHMKSLIHSTWETTCNEPQTKPWTLMVSNWTVKNLMLDTIVLVNHNFVFKKLVLSSAVHVCKFIRLVMS